MLFVLSIQAFLTEQYRALLTVGALQADPRGSRLAPLAPTGFAVSVSRFVLGNDTRVLDLWLGLNNFLQGNTMLDPVPKVVDVLEFVTKFQPQAGDMYLRPTPFTEGVDIP